VAMNHGSVPEVVQPGVTGFVCKSLREVLDAVPRVASLDRAACRSHAEARFSASRMAEGYERVYRNLTQAVTSGRPVDRHRAAGNAGLPVLVPSRVPVAVTEPPRAVAPLADRAHLKGA
jgi:hypothetical protein